MTNYQTGHLAEKKVAEYLVENGFEIIEHNWKTRWCEIVIVGRKNQTLYFIEVKYCRSNDYGAGLDYITSKNSDKWSLLRNFG